MSSLSGARHDLFRKSPLIQKLYKSRGVTDAEDTVMNLDKLLSPADLPDIETAVDRLVLALGRREKIIVVGDYDVDGATSVAICLSCLREMGAEDIEFLVPDRFVHGYGLSVEVTRICLSKDVDVIITVDNGTASFDGVELARDAGVDVIVTDHHLPGEELPPALAIVNPNREDSNFSSKNLAGCGVAFYLMTWLRKRLREAGWFDQKKLPEPNLAAALDLVALGTVADMVPLDRNNRILVYQGLQRIRAGHSCLGIKKLADISKRTLAKMDASDLGFAIGPRLNAAGRLNDMALGVRCLLENDNEQAFKMASQLNALNSERRAVQENMLDQAELFIAGMKDPSSEASLVIYEENFHEGVIGLIASKLKEKWNKPVVVFAKSAVSEGEIKGSARSIEEVHIRDVLQEMATKQPKLISKFGGHSMAAGLTIKRRYLDRFGKLFEKVVSASLTSTSSDTNFLDDGDLGSEELTLETARDIFWAGPWGTQFPEPTFCGKFELISQRQVGLNHLKMVVKKGQSLIDAIAFNSPILSDRVNGVELVYKMKENLYGPSSTLQLLVEEIRESQHVGDLVETKDWKD